MWSCPDFTYPDLAREMLRLSSQVALDLKMQNMNSCFSDPQPSASVIARRVEAISEALVSHLSRVEGMDVAIDGDSLRNLLPVLTQPAPALRSLVINCWDFVYLPKDLLQRNAPRLRQLCLTDCRPPWDSPILKNLTVLRVNYFYSSEVSTFRQFITTLATMIGLRILQLRGCLPSATSLDIIYDHDAVVFPRLQSLDLLGDGVQCGVLFHSITIPGSCRAWFRCLKRRDLHSSGSETLLSSLTRLKDHSERSIQLLLLFVDESYGNEEIKVLAWKEDINLPVLDDVTDAFDFYDIEEDLESPASHLPHTYLTVLPNVGSTEPIAPIVTRAISTLPLSQLRTLYLNGSDLVTETALQYFGRLPHLQMVFIYKRFLSLFFQTLAMPPEENEVCFPAVQTIGLIDLSLYGLECGLMNSASTWETVLDCLVERQSRGLSVRKMVLRGCSDLDEEDVNKLRKIDADLEVEWDEPDSDSLSDSDCTQLSRPGSR
ncbi:hypothetical protein AAF712_014132 [Marasmius tenuissimus]|uniref:F-box domain-containing protein n=1 Tax=Marasmius tenuissimus TaxID=585030 RepID=A0ABR2ZBW1_9AGAR